MFHPWKKLCFTVKTNITQNVAYYKYEVTFYVLQVCLNKLEDLQLAMVITRLYEGDMDSTPPSLKRLLYEVTSTQHLTIIIKLGYEAKVCQVSIYA